MRKGNVGISLQRVRYGQRILDMILVGLQLVSFAKVLNGLRQVSRIQAGNSQGIILLGRFGRRGGSAGPLPTEAQMNLCPLGDVAGVNIYKFFKDFRRFVIILLLKSPNADFKIANCSLVWNFRMRSWRSSNRNRFLTSYFGPSRG